MVATRGSRRRDSDASGSVYTEEANHDDIDADGEMDEDAEGSPDETVAPAVEVEYTRSARGRKIVKKSLVESEDEDAEGEDDERGL